MDVETIQVLTPATRVDPYSLEQIIDWTLTPTERSITTLAPAEPRPSDEPVQDARNAVTSGWTLYLPWSEVVRADERVRVRGVVYPVQGVDSAWGGAGIVVQAFRTEG